MPLNYVPTWYQQSEKHQLISLLTGLLLGLLLTIPPVNAKEAKALVLYLSADRTGAKASGIAIEQGIRTALAENNNRLGQYQVSLKILDHHGSTPRAQKHLKRYLEDPAALALFSGLHSPPLLETRDFINHQGILVLNPWAAAGPITRPQTATNWIFRLSIDDNKAGYVITRHAIKRKGVTRPGLLLEQTGWGMSNQHTMTDALKAEGISPTVTKWFNWGLTEQGARIMLRQIHQSGADAIFLVANASEGKIIARAMVSLPASQRLPIFSHWGITGGDFSEVIDHQARTQLKLDFIQTRFSFLNKLTPHQQQVLELAKALFPQTIRRAEDIKAPSGFIHAYDLTKILIAAVKQTPLSGVMKTDRQAIKEALEHLQQPVRGLIKTYAPPFSPYTPDNPDAHEALGIDDFTMAQYGPDNEILLYSSGDGESP